MQIFSSSKQRRSQPRPRGNWTPDPPEKCPSWVIGLEPTFFIIGKIYISLRSCSPWTEILAPPLVANFPNLNFFKKENGFLKRLSKCLKLLNPIINPSHLRFYFQLWMEWISVSINVYDMSKAFMHICPCMDMYRHMGQWWIEVRLAKVSTLAWINSLSTQIHSQTNERWTTPNPMSGWICRASFRPVLIALYYFAHFTQ